MIRLIPKVIHPFTINSSKISRYVQRRNLWVHEYVGIQILKDNNISTPKGSTASSPEEASEVATNIHCNDFVIKAQVLAGGRGKGRFIDGFTGGVHIAFSNQDVFELSKKMIGNSLVTKQTKSEGLLCQKVYISERIYPRRETYVAFTMDRREKCPVLIGNSLGGVNIEDTAIQSPDSIKKYFININKGLELNTALEFVEKMGIGSSCQQAAAEEIVKLYDVFIKNDCSLLEINPFCETNEGKIMCMDCKMQIDDNALFRHPEFSQLRDKTQEDKREVVASEANINYIGLDGSIGCLVNGAGLAMATMDIIKLNGGTPANFLDIGGGASVDQVTQAFRIISDDPKVKAILVNIFGGIMRCDVIAEGIIKAVKNLNLNIPLVVRLQGSMVEEAQVLIADSGLRILAVDDLSHAAKMVVKLADIVRLAHEASVTVNFEIPI